MGERPARGPPCWAVLPSIANGARRLTGRSRLTTPTSVVGSTRTAVRSQKVSGSKSFDSAKKPWKKPGSGNADQISHLTEEMTKLKKRLKKSKKHSKKRARDSLDSDSNSS